MAEHMNDSYERCIGELRRRCQNRGLSYNVKGEIAKRVSEEESEMFYDAGSHIADLYRSGEYQGSKYMTSDDFVRYFKSRRAFLRPDTVGDKETAPALGNSAVPQRRTARTADAGGKEGHLSRLGLALSEFAEKWFPVERTEGRVEGKRFRLPAAVMGSIAVFAVSLGLIVSGSVMMGNATGEVGKMESTIAALEAEQVELQGQLDLKYNVDQIAVEARELGMIQRQYADREYLPADREEQIIMPEDKEPDRIGLSALLAAFGIELD